MVGADGGAQETQAKGDLAPLLQGPACCLAQAGFGLERERAMIVHMRGPSKHPELITHIHHPHFLQGL